MITERDLKVLNLIRQYHWLEVAMIRDVVSSDKDASAASEQLHNLIEAGYVRGQAIERRGENGKSTGEGE